MLQPMLGEAIQVDVQPDWFDRFNAIVAIVGASLTVGGVVVAALAANWAREAARHAREAVDAANEQAKASNDLLKIEQERQADAIEANNRAQAEQVSVWVDYEARRVIIRNASPQPIYEARLIAVPRGRLADSLTKFWEVIPPPAATTVLPILSDKDSQVTPDNEAWWSPPIPLENTFDSGREVPNHPVLLAMDERAKSDPDQAIPDGMGVGVTLRFRDQAGVGWVRPGDGGLERDPTSSS